ncbi:MAG TPA: cupin domain-containing protein [Acidimicrobiales bacterium]|nr:cupin domain-containing protein [Acidimicrobiales bacterium]
MPFLEWSDMVTGEPLPGWHAAFFHSAHMTFALYDIDAGAAALHEHNHEQEEVWNVVEGALEVTVDGVTRTVAAGCAVVVAPWTRHSVTPTGPARAVVADYPLRPHLPGMGHAHEE